MPITAANAAIMARTIDERDLERELLRKAAAALREASPRCRDCGRTPLTGERVHVYPRGHRVCELCRPLRREAPERSERVRSGESAVLRVQALGAR
jgi:hypothetical protein